MRESTPSRDVRSPRPDASESTRPSHGDNHPASLAFHCFNNAAQIALAVKLRVGLVPIPHDYSVAAMSADLARVTDLISEGGEQLGKLIELFERQERTIEEQRVENIRIARHNSELAQVVIRLTGQLEDEQHAKVIEENRPSTDILSAEVGEESYI
jgi:hypothetical protein